MPIHPLQLHERKLTRDHLKTPVFAQHRVQPGSGHSRGGQHQYADHAAPSRLVTCSRRNPSIAAVETATPIPFATMLLIPTTRPDASAKGPPELPGASRISAVIQCPSDAAWMMPRLIAPDSPSGWPAARTT